MDYIADFTAKALAGRPVYEVTRQPDALRQTAADYAGLGYSPIPLFADTNKPIGAWSTLPIPSLWLGVDAGAHIGLRAGDGIAFLDLDAKKDPGSVDAGKRYLAGLGYMPDGDYPLVRTPSGGAHVYMSFKGDLPGHVRTLRHDFAAGEFRFGPAAMVVAPPSTRDGVAYELVAGDLRQLPKLEAADVLPLLQNQDTGATDDLAEAILATTPRGELGTISNKTWGLLRGNGCEKYPSRSEAECAIVAGLVNAGLSFGGILGLFQTWPAAGKFRELHTARPANAIRYLRRTWESAVKFVGAHVSEGRKAAFLALQWAQETSWPGITGRSDHAAFVTHAMTAYSCGKLTYGLSVRELAEGMGSSLNTAQHANSRLLADKLILRAKTAVAGKSACWQLGAVCIVDTLPHVPACEGVYQLCTPLPVFDADCFRWAGLGKTCAELYALLRAGPATGAELAKRSGRSVSTVRRNLRKMRRLIEPETAEVLRLVELDADNCTWRAVDVDLAAVARAVGTAGKGEHQKAEHARQRAGFARAILRQKAGDVPAPVTGAAAREASKGRKKRIGAIEAAQEHGKELPVWEGLT
jgi:hypothetical protein